MREIICSPNQWTQVLWEAGPFPYISALSYYNPWFSPPAFIRVRRHSLGPPFYWDVPLALGETMHIWHSPLDWYASTEVFPESVFVIVRVW